MDDWDDEGNFNILVFLLQGRINRNDHWEFGVSLRGLLKQIRRVVKESGATLEWVDVPEKQYRRTETGKEPLGYNRSFYKLSVYIPRPPEPEKPPQFACHADRIAAQEAAAQETRDMLARHGVEYAD